jgi:hypothetical protein
MTSSVYNYVNNAKLWLPMTAACHDPVNVRTLDKSGNGLHYRFGDGVTANTFPTKLTARGYSFDGSNDYLIALANQTNAITEATWAVLYRETLVTTTEYISSHWDAGGTRHLILHTTSNIQFYCGDIVNFALVNTAPIRGQASFVAGYRTIDGFRRVYYNGIVGTPSNTGVTLPSTTVISNPYLGRGSGGGISSCDILWHGHWEYALSELQLRDLEQRLRRQLNDV